MTQLPSLFGVQGGGHNFFERAALFVRHLGQTQPLVRKPSVRGALRLG